VARHRIDRQRTASSAFWTTASVDAVATGLTSTVAGSAGIGLLGTPAMGAVENFFGSLF
jgi:hypothetical protein